MVGRFSLCPVPLAVEEWMDDIGRQSQLVVQGKIDSALMRWSSTHAPGDEKVDISHTPPRADLSYENKEMEASAPSR